MSTALRGWAAFELLLLFVCALSHPHLSSAAVLSSSQLTRCVAGEAVDGTPSTNATCSQKIVVTLTVPTGQSSGSQYIEATLSSVDYGNNVSTRSLEQPLRIAITKTPVFAVYPLTYRRNFNYAPNELLLSVASCKDGAYQPDVTCGWFMDSSGNRIPESQGFCCPCSASDAWQQTVGGGAITTSRGNLNCNLFAQNLFLTGVPSTASCLRFDPQWYSGYAIGSASYDFVLTVTITQGPSATLPPAASATAPRPPPPAAAAAAAASPGGVNETLAVSPADLRAVNSARSVLVELLGDLGGFAETPVLSSSMLFMPFFTNGTSGDSREWLIIDKTQVTLDGTECNKVGASFSAFRNQPSQCGVPQGSCLNNQLRDFLLADRARVASGQAPLYLASLYGAGSIRDPLPRAPQPGSKRLAFPITQLRNTVVQLTLSADSIRFVVNVSPGFIAAARLVDFSGRNASSFTALSGNGRVLVAVTNNGTLSAGYTVAIVNCTPGVSVFQSQGEVTVAPGATAEQVLTCAVEDDLAGRRSCVVTLRDSQFRLIDSRELLFFTNATVYDSAPFLGRNVSGPGAGKTPGMQKACSDCSGFSDALCFVRARCWGSFGKMLGVYLGAAALGFVLWKLGAIRALTGALRSMCCSGGGAGAAPAAAKRGVGCCGRGQQSPPPQQQVQRRDDRRRRRGGGRRDRRENDDDDDGRGRRAGRGGHRAWWPWGRRARAYEQSDSSSGGGSSSSEDDEEASRRERKERRAAERRKKREQAAAAAEKAKKKGKGQQQQPEERGRYGSIGSRGIGAGHISRPPPAAVVPTHLLAAQFGAGPPPMPLMQQGGVAPPAHLSGGGLWSVAPPPQNRQQQPQQEQQQQGGGRRRSSAAAEWLERTLLRRNNPEQRAAAGQGGQIPRRLADMLAAAAAAEAEERRSQRRSHQQPPAAAAHHQQQQQPHQPDAAAAGYAGQAASALSAASGGAFSPRAAFELLAQGATQAFLPVAPDFPGAFSPGPQACVAGVLFRQPGGGPGGGDAFVFSLHPERRVQRRFWFQQGNGTGHYAEFCRYDLVAF